MGRFVEHSGSRGPLVVSRGSRDSSQSRGTAIEGLAQSIHPKKSRCRNEHITKSNQNLINYVKLNCNISMSSATNGEASIAKSLRCSSLSCHNHRMGSII